MERSTHILWSGLLLHFVVGLAFCFLLKEEGIALNVNINLQQPVSTTGPRFIGVDIGIPLLLSGNISRIDLNSSRLLELTRAYSPCYVRVGGTAADRLIFDPHAVRMVNFTFGTFLWNKIHQLAEVSGWDLIFDLNVLNRKEGHWDPSNARELLQYSQHRGYKIPCFQLGNEPVAFNKTMHTTMEPEAMAEAYLRLRSLMNEFPMYRNSCLLGPEVGGVNRQANRDYLTRFFQSGGVKALTDVGMHHYSQASHTIPLTVDFFINPQTMHQLERVLQIFTSLCDKMAPGLPLWLSETGTTGWNVAGDVTLRTTYVDGFLWLDKLGLSAKYGLQHVNRQQFFSILIGGTTDFEPYPDYYLTLLYKRLVQGPVFKVLSSTPTVRLYAHCANPDSYPKGAVTVYVINVENVDVTLTFNQFSGQQADIYMLSPGDDNGLSSRVVALNGKQLVMTGDKLPPLPPKHVTGAITVTARTFGFVVFPHANVHACK